MAGPRLAFEDADLKQLRVSVIELLGPDVRVGVRSLRDPTPLPALPPEEEAAIANAVEKRRREFTAGRVLARTLLAEVGRPISTLARKTNRAPAWPEGVRGSISHTDEVAVVAVANGNRSFGIDVEGGAPLPEDMMPFVLRPEERSALKSGRTGELAKIVFSAKEAFYKAQHQHTGVLLDFLDVSLDLDPARQRFTVAVHHPAKADLPDQTPEGGWRRVGPWVLTAIRLRL